MFSLENQPLKLGNVNPRTELHGDEHKLAVDLTFELKTSNTILNEFDKNLLPALYQKAQGDAQETLIDDHLPELKFPLMGPIKYGWEGAGYTTTVHHGISGTDDIDLIETQIDGFKFECQDGGTVSVKFRIIAHPKPEDIGRLAEKIQQEVNITLTPPSADKQFQMDLAKHKDEEE